MGARRSSPRPRAVPLFRESLVFQVATTVRVLLSVVGVFAGVYAYSTSAMAEVEDDTRQGASHNLSNLSRELLIKLFYTQYDNITNEQDILKYRSLFEDSYNGALPARNGGDAQTDRLDSGNSTDRHSFGETKIPDTVWSFDSAEGAQLYPDPYQDKGEIYAVSGSRRASIEFWNGTFLDLFGWNNIYRELNSLADSELLQVASCASNSAERSNLDYCDTDIELTSNYDNGNTLNKPNGFVYQDSNDADLFSGPSSNPINVTYDAPLTHSLWDTIPLQGDLILLSQCGGALACASIHVDLPAILVELPTPPIDDLTIPIDLQPAGPEILTGDPGFGSDPPGGSASLPAAPVPEASTWSMGLIGVGIIALVFRQRHKRAIKQASTIDVHGISEKRGASSV